MISCIYCWEFKFDLPGSHFSCHILMLGKWKSSGHVCKYYTSFGWTRSTTIPTGPILCLPKVRIHFWRCAQSKHWSREENRFLCFKLQVLHSFISYCLSLFSSSPYNALFSPLQSSDYFYCFRDFQRVDKISWVMSYGVSRLSTNFVNLMSVMVLGY